MPNSHTTALALKEQPTNAVKPFFPPDLWHYLVSTFLPAYSRVGRNSFHNTCKALSQSRFINLRKPTIMEVVESCKTPEDALNILSDQSLCEQLPFNGLLIVAGAHPQITEFLLKIPIFKAKATNQEWGFLASKNIESARLILENKMLDLFGKAYVVNHHMSLALSFITSLKDSEIDTLFRENTVNLENLLSIVLENKRTILDLPLLRQVELFNIPELERKLLVGRYKTFFSQFRSIEDKSQWIVFRSLEEHKTVRNYPSSIVLKMISKHGLAQFILDNSKMISSLNHNDLLELGKHNIHIAKRILSEQGLRAKLAEKDLFELSLCFEELAERYLDDKANLSNDDLTKIGYVSEKLARMVLNKFHFESSEINTICHRFPNLELEIMLGNKYPSKIFKDYFQYDCFDERVKTCSYGAQHINEEMLHKLSKEKLALCCMKFAKAALITLNNDKLREKLFKTNRAVITAVASLPYVAVNDILLKSKKKLTVVRKDIKNKMRFRVHTYHKIMEMTCKLRQSIPEVTHTLAQNELPRNIKRAAEEEISSTDTGRPKKR